MEAKATLFAAYEKKNAADGYRFGFIKGETVYRFDIDTLPLEWVNLTRESSKRGSAAKLRLYIPAKVRKELIASGKATPFCKRADLEPGNGWNRGDNFERLNVEEAGRKWRKNSDRFDEAGDVVINGKRIQIKLNGGGIVTAKALGITVEA